MERLKDCTACGLYQTCNSVGLCAPSKPTAKIHVILETPSYLDDVKGTVAQSEREEYIRAIMTRGCGIDQDLVSFGYLVKCRPMDGAYPDRTQIEACRPNLETELTELDPLVIVAMGTTVAQTLLNTEDKITYLRNGHHEIEIGGKTRKLVCTFSPTYAQQSEQNAVEFASDLHRAHELTDPIAAQQEAEKETTQITLVNSMGQFTQLLGYIRQTGLCCFDFETAGGDGVDALQWYMRKEGQDERFRATAVSISFQVGSSYVIPLHHYETPFSGAQVKTILKLLGERVFANPDIRKVGHNLKFDMHVVAVHGAGVFRGRLDDTMLMHHLLDETVKHGLKELVTALHPQFQGYEKEVKQTDWAKVPLYTLVKYNAKDTDATLRLLTFFEAQLLNDPRLYKIYRNLTIPFLKSSFEAEHAGMLIDRPYLQEAVEGANLMAAEFVEKLENHPTVLKFSAAERERVTTEAILNLGQRLREAFTKSRLSWEAKQRAKIEKYTGDPKAAAKLAKAQADLDAGYNHEPTKTEEKYAAELAQLKSGAKTPYGGINFASVPQLRELLYTSKGFNLKAASESTDEKALKELSDKSGFVDGLLTLRSLRKTVSTYMVGILDRLDAADRVHTSFLIHGTASGRISSANPNLQNLPNSDRIKTEELKKVVAAIKSSFIAPEGHHIVQVDFSQAELRVIAELADDPNMLKAYADGLDLHAVTGAKLAGFKDVQEFYEKLPKDEQKKFRTNAKAANFGLIYGMSAPSFRDYAKDTYGFIMSEKEAVASRDAFFQLYPNLLRYHSIYKAKALKFKQVRTLFGRCRRLPDIDTYDRKAQGEAERAAINSPVQGTAGEFTLFGVCMLKLRLDPRVIFVNTIHDSVLLYIPEDLMESTLPMVKATMENLPTLRYFDTELKKVSMKVDIEAATTNWKSMQPVEL